MTIKPPPSPSDAPFTPEQDAFLSGFFSGLTNRGLSFAAAEPAAGPAAEKKLIPEERIKQELHPFDAFPRIRSKARTNAAPEKEDIFRFKWNGLFWLAPVHEGYMCRLRIPGGQVRSHQVRELASIADDIASGYLQITTRNHFHISVVQPRDCPELLRRIQDAGLHSRGAGADNLRNFTANPTAGVDPYELIDVTPHVNRLAQYIINSLEFYDLPRKFNVSFDGGGLVGVAEDTNDIGLRAIELREPPEGHPLRGRIEAGICFQILLGGVTGHEEFAENCGAICRADDAVEVVAALTRTYIRNGNRSNRGKSRLIYLLKDWGFEKYLAAADELLDGELIRFDLQDPANTALIVPREKPNPPHPHLGAHPQKQEGLSWLGGHIPVGILPTPQVRALCEIADAFGNGEMRLTIFQNLILPNIPTGKLEAARAALEAAGLRDTASLIRGGVAACTGNRYCKYASADTKGNAIDLVDFLDAHIELDKPINIHVTGCPHSCAQHYIGDIGLLACKVKKSDNAEPVEGYHVFVGGGFGPNKSLGRQLFKSIPAGEELNTRILALLQAYLKERKESETFLDFTTRTDSETLVAMTERFLVANSRVA